MITAPKLRGVIKAFKKARNIPTWTKAVKAFAADLGVTHGSVWRYLSGARGMLQVVENGIRRIAAEVGVEV